MRLALFKESNLPFQQNQTIIVDSGYTGILKLFPNALVPIKRNSKNNKSKQEISKINKNISIERIIVKNVIADLKKFGILKPQLYFFKSIKSNLCKVV
jgi:hypothetical protein